MGNTYRVTYVDTQGQTRSVCICAASSSAAACAVKWDLDLKVRYIDAVEELKPTPKESEAASE